MLASPATLLAAAASALTGAAIAIPSDAHNRPLGVTVTGTFVGTVILEATVATQAEVNAATAVWAPVTGASWTAPAAVGINAPFTHIRARVSAYTSGAITVKAA
jgi:hypothetical protein